MNTVIVAVNLMNFKLGVVVESKLYQDLKYCWKAGYKLNQIKEYCNTHLSIEELQTKFTIMWENELQNKFGGVL